MEEDASLFPKKELLDNVPLSEDGNKGLFTNNRCLAKMKINDVLHSFL